MADLGSLLGAAGAGGAIGKAIVMLELDSGKYAAEMKAAEAQTKTGTSRMGSAMSKFGITSNMLLAGIGVAFVAIGVKAVQAAIESQKVMAQTEAVLKSTGGAANVTADEVLGLADRLRDLTGVDDEAIQASSNLLLTFRDIRNEAGQNNDIFNQTQTAILDMSTAMNQGAIPSSDQLKTSTIQLGKALNDPIQGMTALRRVGVSFTESQVETISKLQESGDLMGAQKIVLEELRKEFGGAAKAAGDTFAGKLAILNSQFGDVLETIGMSLLPILEDLLGVVEKLLPAIKFLGENFGLVVDALLGFAAVKFVPGLLIGIAAGLEAIGVQGLAQRITQVAVAIGTLGTGLSAMLALDLAGLAYLIHKIATGADPTFAKELGHELAGIASELPGFTKRAEEHTEEMDRLAHSHKEAGKAVRNFANMTDNELKDWKQATHDSIRAYILDLSNLSGQSEVTREDFVRAHRAMETRAREMAQALKEISKEKWINDEYVAFLAEQGPEFLITFADLNDRQQRRMQGHWEDSTGKIKDSNQGVKDIIGTLDRLDKGNTKHTVEIKYEYVGFDPTKPGMGGPQP